MARLPGLREIRRNHAIEHATIAVLFQRRGRPVSVFGRSDPAGFHIHGPFSAAEVESAVDEAVRRLRAGERHLAVSPMCGTNLVVTGTLAGSAALLAAGRSRRDGWPNAVLAAIGATLAAARVGLWLQQHATTDANIGGTTVRSTAELPRRRGARHVRVLLREGSD